MCARTAWLARLTAALVLALLVAGAPPGWVQSGTLSPAELAKVILDAAKLPGLIEGYITEVQVLPPGPPLPPPAKPDDPVQVYEFPQDEAFQIAGRIVLMTMTSFRCAPGAYLVDDTRFQVTSEGPGATPKRELYWFDGAGGERFFMPGYVAQHVAPGDVSVTPEPGRGLDRLESALQADLGLEQGQIRRLLKRWDGAVVTVTPGITRLGLECVRVSCRKTDPIPVEWVEWFAPSRSYHCVERIQRSHPLNGHTKFHQMRVERFAEVIDGYWVPAMTRYTGTDLAPDGVSVVVINSVTTCTGIRTRDAATLAMEPLLPNGTAVYEGTNRSVIGDDTRDLELQLRSGQLPPVLPVPDLEAEGL
ncbi:MAG TPA: hypothetical protein PLD23_06185 [Armatimonadota bacterium]|nr:hypothetical protein [Armatimonadota bacterium]